MPVNPARVREQDRIRRLAVRSFAELWRRRPGDDPVRVRDFLTEFLPTIIDAFADVAATSAAEFFEAETTLRATLAAPPTADVVTSGIRARLAPMFGGAGTDAARVLLSQMVDYQTLQAGDVTVYESAASNGVRYAWVPSGQKTCPYCTVKASRGPIYYSSSAAGTALNGRHSSCDCIAVPVRDNADIRRLRSAGYNPDAYRAEYEAATAATGSTDINAVVAEMARQRAA